MELEESLLKPEELIMQEAGNEYFLVVPIYPSLLRKDIELETLAGFHFQKASEETEKELKSSPKLFSEVIYWGENKLARDLMLNGHVGLITQTSSSSLLPPQYVNFSEEKLKAYFAAEAGAEYLIDDLYGPPFVYQTKNANKVQAALLRNWSINYLNACLKEYMERNRI
jgi:hypothetical protein